MTPIALRSFRGRRPVSRRRQAGVAWCRRRLRYGAPSQSSCWQIINKRFYLFPLLRHLRHQGVKSGGQCDPVLPRRDLVSQGNTPRVQCAEAGRTPLAAARARSADPRQSSAFTSKQQIVVRIAETTRSASGIVIPGRGSGTISRIAQPPIQTRQGPVDSRRLSHHLS